MTAELSPREILGIGPGDGAEEARRAYRRLAMRWHPDRNPDAGATARFQEIQSAYRRLTAELELAETESMEPTTTEEAEAERPEWMRDGVFSERTGLGLLEQLPFAALLLLALGSWGWMALPGVLGWGAFSVALLMAGAAYKRGVSPLALRAEFWFKAALRVYFVALLGWAVWVLARKNWELLPGTL